MNITKNVKKFIKFKELFFLSLPGVLFLFVFNYIPMYGIILPFKNYKYNLGFFKSEWVGFKNFKFLFNSDNAFRITKNVILLNSSFIIVNTLLSILFALLLYEMSKKSVKIYQTILFLPYFISWVVASYILIALLDMQHGFVNNILRVFGKSEILWYNEPKYWPAILTLANAWKNVGYSTIIYYAGLLGIDKSYYDAAEVDGANKFQKMRLISIPLIMPLISILFLLSAGRIFYGNFDMFYNLTRDSSLLYPTTDVIDTFVFRALRTSGDIGMASAAGIYQSTVGFIIVVAVNAIIKKINPDNSLF